MWLSIVVLVAECMMLLGCRSSRNEGAGALAPDHKQVLSQHKNCASDSECLPRMTCASIYNASTHETHGECIIKCGGVSGCPSGMQCVTSPHVTVPDGEKFCSSIPTPP